MKEIASVFDDAHCARLAEDVAAGRMTATQAIQIAMATGRVQGLFMSANKLAQDSGIVREFNKTRHGANANDE
jgi:hypothetical protein